MRRVSCKAAFTRTDGCVGPPRRSRKEEALHLSLNPKPKTLPPPPHKKKQEQKDKESIAECKTQPSHLLKQEDEPAESLNAILPDSSEFGAALRAKEGHQPAPRELKNPPKSFQNSTKALSPQPSTLSSEPKALSPKPLSPKPLSPEDPQMDPFSFHRSAATAFSFFCRVSS